MFFTSLGENCFFNNLLYLLYPDSAYLELGDLGHRVKRVDGQEVGCSFLEMKAHKHDPGRDLVGNLSFHPGLSRAAKLLPPAHYQA